MMVYSQRSTSPSPSVGQRGLSWRNREESFGLDTSLASILRGEPTVFRIRAPGSQEHLAHVVGGPRHPLAWRRPATEAAPAASSRRSLHAVTGQVSAEPGVTAPAASSKPTTSTDSHIADVDRRLRPGAGVPSGAPLATSEPPPGGLRAISPPRRLSSIDGARTFGPTDHGKVHRTVGVARVLRTNVLWAGAVVQMVFQGARAFR